MHIHEPERLDSISVTNQSDQARAGASNQSAQARPVPCDVCHSLRKSKALPKSMGELKEFHLGLKFDHGRLPCAACHSEGQLPRLHLAGGEVLELRDSLRLCAQCHGPQFRDYQNGSHGGMTGYWDLHQGPRTRNHCVDCHHPHNPQIEPVMPVAAPRDRFFVQGAEAVEEGKMH